jgi:hypothetical protein
MLVLFVYITRLASNEIFSPSNKIHREVGRAKDLSAHLFVIITRLVALNYPIVRDRDKGRSSKKKEIKP